MEVKKIMEVEIKKGVKFNVGTYTFQFATNQDCTEWAEVKPKNKALLNTLLPIEIVGDMSEEEVKTTLKPSFFSIMNYELWFYLFDGFYTRLKLDNGNWVSYIAKLNHDAPVVVNELMYSLDIIHEFTKIWDKEPYISDVKSAFGKAYKESQKVQVEIKADACNVPFGYPPYTVTPEHTIYQTDHTIPTFPVLPPIEVKKKEYKPDYTLIPFEALEEVVKVLEFGKEKYPANDWEKQDFDKHYRSLLRHVINAKQGNDAESGLPHLAHAACRILMMLALQKRKEHERSKDSL